MAYRHEIKALEDLVHHVKIKVNGTEISQKENDKKLYELSGEIKKKVDFVTYLK